MLVGFDPIKTYVKSNSAGMVCKAPDLAGGQLLGIFSINPDSADLHDTGKLQNVIASDRFFIRPQDAGQDVFK